MIGCHYNGGTLYMRAAKPYMIHVQVRDFCREKKTDKSGRNFRLLGSFEGILSKMTVTFCRKIFSINFTTVVFGAKPSREKYSLEKLQDKTWSSQLTVKPTKNLAAKAASHRRRKFGFRILFSPSFGRRIIRREKRFLLLLMLSS